jgi:hypothetical protein
MLEILDGLIATCAVVLALSLIVQAIQQILKQLFSMKAAYMERELVMMFLTDDAFAKFKTECGKFTKKLLPDWRVLQLIKPDDRKIVDELIDKLQSIGYKNIEILEKLNVEQLQEIIKELPLFKDQIPTMQPQLKDALECVTKWFDIAKQSFQDHYERKMKVWAVGISTVIVLALNANLFDIYKEFSQSKSLRDAAITWAEKTVSQPRDSVITFVQTGRQDCVVVKQHNDTTSMNIVKQKISEIQTMVADSSFQIMRWNKFQSVHKETWLRKVSVLIGGWLGMILLVSLGAPFWYDFLKTVMGFKNSFKKEEEKK